MPRLLWAAIILSGALSAYPSSWTVTRNAHFEIYSEAGPEQGRKALQWFEELKAFFAHNGLIESRSEPSDRSPVRVIAFNSEKDYLAFRLTQSADAYYVGTDSQDYIVLPGLGPKEFVMAAHEYAHLVFHRNGLKLPFWLNEGLAEVFSTVRRTATGWEFGSALPARVETLRRHKLLPLDELFSLRPDSKFLQTRDGSAIFYAESWAVADLLISSGHNLDPDEPTIAALLKRDLRDWAATPTCITARETPQPKSEAAKLSKIEIDAVLAGLLLADNNLDRAEAAYKDLIRLKPDPNFHAALGEIALRRGNHAAAIEEWSQAIDAGISDANLCYRFAVLADLNGLPEAHIRRALERAVELNPDLDDARYKLALMENNSGNYAAAIAQLDAMRHVSLERVFNFWSTKAYALTELDRREEAKAAAEEALKHATNAGDQARAKQLAYMAETDLTVRFVPDAAGHLKLTTTRVPHGTADWNPFVEPEDHIQQAEGTLREVQCGGGRLTGFILETPSGMLRLAVPDPQHVQMRHSPSEFLCGAQTSQRVKVEYAITGVLRGMEFVN